MEERIDENIALLESGELLTDVEREIFEKVKAAGSSISETVVSRCAGGWVRDKLLGQQSDDIDICVEHTNATDFGKALAAQFPEGKTKIVTLQENPEQSKNMKTVRVCIFENKWIDICGLRGDSNNKNQDSTPLSDAQHRDFTINALFYNITASKVEDFVGGIPDLKSGTIRTPIDAALTFGEDPLRIIRAARFHARLGYGFDDSIFEAAKSQLQNFEAKITRERVVAELTKIIEKNGIIDFISYINSIGFFDAIFDPFHMFEIDGEEALNRVKKALSRNPANHVSAIVFGAIYYPVYGLEPKQDPEHPKKRMPAIEWLVCRALKMPVRVAEDANMLVTGAKGTIGLKLNRVDVGHWIRKVGSIWPFAKYLIFDDEAYNKTSELEKFINDENMSDIYEMKALINGKELAKIIGVKPGKGFSAKVDELIDWQLENPNGTAEDYEAFYQMNKKNP